MIYWDNAATTWPKPTAVLTEMNRVIRQYGANPGRAGHRMSLAAAEQVYRCREAVASFFGLEDATGVVFMPNCTTAMNTVIHGVLADGGNAVASDLEHNAVWRPLSALPDSERRVTYVSYTPDQEELVRRFRTAVTPGTKLVVCTHASNVFGVVLPVSRIAQVVHERGALLCVDAAQTAGVLPIDMERDAIDFLCVAAHKGLYAPTGMGLLLCRNRDAVAPLIRGGTGSHSLSFEQPEELPERLESGTPNLAGIGGLLAGISFVNRRGRDAIYRHEIQLLQQVYDNLLKCEGVQLYTQKPAVGSTAPVLSLTIDGVPSEQVAAFLDKNGIATRAGLHCAPLAHRHFGTLPHGTVRLAPSAFSTDAEAQYICKIFHHFVQKNIAHNGKYGIIGV